MTDMPMTSPGAWGPGKPKNLQEALAKVRASLDLVDTTLGKVKSPAADDVANIKDAAEGLLGVLNRSSTGQQVRTRIAQFDAGPRPRRRRSTGGSTRATCRWRRPVHCWEASRTSRPSRRISEIRQQSTYAACSTVFTLTAVPLLCRYAGQPRAPPSGGCGRAGSPSSAGGSSRERAAGYQQRAVRLAHLTVRDGDRRDGDDDRQPGRAVQRDPHAVSSRELGTGAIPARRCVMVATRIGPPRTTTIATTNATSTRGFDATAAGSISMPEVTKNTGMRRPNASPSSLCSSDRCPWGISRRRMNPAANAPSTTSNPKAAARIESVMSMRTTRRTVSWAGLLTGPDDLVESGSRRDPRRHERHRDGDGAEAEEHEDGLQGTARPQQDGHGDDRPQLPEGAVVEEGGPNGVAS